MLDTNKLYIFSVFFVIAVFISDILKRLFLLTNVAT